MATSCIFGFYKNGLLKIDYNNSDSYPSGFGKDVVSFIRENTIEELHELFDKITTVDRKAEPNEQQLRDMTNKGIYLDFGREEGFNWELISVLNGGFLEYYKRDVYFISDFSKWFYSGQDWAYIINLDDEIFEVYKLKYSGDKEKELEENNRYNETYKLVVTYKLNQIPRDWYNRI